MSVRDQYEAERKRQQLAVRERLLRKVVNQHGCSMRRHRGTDLFQLFDADGILITDFAPLDSAEIQWSLHLAWDRFYDLLRELYDQRGHILELEDDGVAPTAEQVAAFEAAAQEQFRAEQVAARLLGVEPDGDFERKWRDRGLRSALAALGERFENE